MLRKIAFTILLITVLLTTSAAMPAMAQPKAPTFEKVFTPPIPDLGWLGLDSRLTQFNSALYMAANTSVGVRIYRSFDGKTWSLVDNGDYGLDPIYQNSWDTTVFKGKLYVPTLCFYSTAPPCPGSILLRSSNGTDWEKIPLDTAQYMLDKVGEFQGMLYATSVASNDPNSGGHILRSRSGDPGTWTVVKNLEANVESSSSPTVYHGKVYISGYVTGAVDVIIWSSSDGLNWQAQHIQITQALNGAWAMRDGTLTVYKDNLYLSTLNSNDGGAIYRTHDGKNWQRVFQISPAGGISFAALQDLIEYQGDLYAALSYSDGTFGTQIWRSSTGNPGTWVKISDDASWEHTWTERGSLGVFKGDLYVTDADGFNPGVYRMSGH